LVYSIWTTWMAPFALWANRLVGEVSVNKERSSLIHPSMEMRDVHVLYASTLSLGFETEYSL